MAKKRSFFERLTGGVRLDDEDEATIIESPAVRSRYGRSVGRYEEEETRDLHPLEENDPTRRFLDEEEEEGELTVDLYQTPTEIIIQAFVAGVRPEDLTIHITRDVITLKGKREDVRKIDTDNFFLQELYWGTFSRNIALPQEIEPEEAEAVEKHGLLMIRLPKIDKDKQTNLKVKSM